MKIPTFSNSDPIVFWINLGRQIEKGNKIFLFTAGESILSWERNFDLKDFDKMLPEILKPDLVSKYSKRMVKGFTENFECESESPSDFM